LSNQGREHQIYLCHFPNSDDFDANLYSNVSRKVTSAKVAGGRRVPQFPATFFCTLQSSAFFIFNSQFSILNLLFPVSCFLFVDVTRK
jgi:hypothetical protein